MKTENLPQVYNERGQVKWISLVNGAPVDQDFDYLDHYYRWYDTVPFGHAHRLTPAI